jgi:hypothetical protein
MLPAQQGLSRRKVRFPVKKVIAFGIAAGSATASMVLFGSGMSAALTGHPSPPKFPAPAPVNYVGRTFADAQAAAGRGNVTLVVVGSTGDSLQQPQCIVSNSQAAIYMVPVQTPPWVVEPQAGTLASNTVSVFLNCDGAVASATSQGPSVQSPAGAAAKAAQTPPPS